MFLMFGKRIQSWLWHFQLGKLFHLLFLIQCPVCNLKCPACTTAVTCNFLLDPVQMFPLFAFAPFINIPFILFDTESLKIGSYRRLTIDREGDAEKNHSNKEGNGREITLSVANLHEDINLNHLGDAPGQDDFHTNIPRHKHSLKYAWFCLKTFYTAPCSKFLFNLVSLADINHHNYRS